MVRKNPDYQKIVSEKWRKELKTFTMLLIFWSLGVLASVEAHSQTRLSDQSNSLSLFSKGQPNLTNPLSFNRELTEIYTILHEPLFNLAGTDTLLESWLVEEYSFSVDQLEWRFKLRSGVRWSDDEVLDTEDIKFTFDFILGSNIFRNPNSVYLREQVKMIIIDDDHSFRIKLRKPNPRFVHDFLTARREGTFYILPQHIWGDKVDTWTSHLLSPGDLSPYVGTGPYTLESSTDVEITFVRNDKWWGAKTGFHELPKPEKIVIRYFDTDKEPIDALKLDELDVGAEVDARSFEEIQIENPYVIGWNRTQPIAWPSQCPRQLDFNTLNPPWNNPALRQAIAHFISQTQIVNEAFDGENYPSPTIFPTFSALQQYTEAIVAAGISMSGVADPSSGNAKMLSAGYMKNGEGIYGKDDEELALTIHVADQPSIDSVVAESVAKTLNNAGIKTMIEIVPADELWAWIMPPGKFEAVYSWLGCASVVDPYASLRRYHPKYAVEIGIRSPGNNNMARWNTEAAQQYGLLIDKMEKTAPGDPKLIHLVNEAYTLIAKEMPFIPLIQEPRIIPFSTSRWEGWPAADQPYAMPKIFWGQFHKIVHNLTSSGSGKE